MRRLAIGSGEAFAERDIAPCPFVALTSDTSYHIGNVGARQCEEYVVTKRRVAKFLYREIARMAGESLTYLFDARSGAGDERGTDLVTTNNIGNCVAESSCTDNRHLRALSLVSRVSRHNSIYYT